MSIEQNLTIDYVGKYNDKNAVILAIFDELDWSDEGSHLQKLQDKINAYLQYVEEGQLKENYPELASLPVCIEILSKHDYPQTGHEYLSRAAELIKRVSSRISISQRKLEM